MKVLTPFPVSPSSLGSELLRRRQSALEGALDPEALPPVLRVHGFRLLLFRVSERQGLEH